MLNHFILGRWGIVGDVIDAGRGGKAGEDGRYDVVDMDAAKYLAGQVYAVRPSLPHTVQRAASRPVNSRQAKHPHIGAESLPADVRRRAGRAPPVANFRAFIDPRAASVAIHAGG